MHKYLKYILLLLITVIFCKILYFFRGITWIDLPIMNLDYALYYARFLKSKELLLQHFALSAFDPYEMSGTIYGPLHESGNHLLNCTALFFSLFVSDPKALLISEFIFILTIVFLPLLCSYLLFKSKITIIWAALISIASYGVYEPFTREMLGTGLLGFQLASSLSILLIILFHQFVNEARKDLVKYFYLLAIIIPLASPIVLIFLIPALILIAILYFNNLNHVAIWHIIAITFVSIVFNLFWILPYLSFSDWLINIGYLSTGGWKQVFWTFNFSSQFYFHILRSSFLLYIFVLTLVFIYTNKKQALLFSTLLIFLALLAYFADQVITTSFQAYRFTFSFWTLVAILSIGGINYLSSRSKLYNYATAFLLVSLIIGFVCGHIIDGPLFFVTKFKNKLTKPQQEILHFLKSTKPRGRVLIEVGEWSQPHFASLVPVLTGHILTGPGNPGNILKSNYTGLLSLKKENYQPKLHNQSMTTLSEKDLRGILETFNTGFIILSSQAAYKQLVQFENLVENYHLNNNFAVFKTKITPTWFLKGSGKLDADYNRIVIQNPKSQELIIKFHYLKSMKVEDCGAIFPVKTPYAQMPLIGIKNNNCDRISIIN